MVYNAQDLETHPEVSLKRGGLILIALISGGDYEDVSDSIAAIMDGIPT
jgi:hypothetical protein